MKKHRVASGERFNGLEWFVFPGVGPIPQSISTITSCPFCSPDPARVFFRGDRVFALWDAFPINPGHALLVPGRLQLGDPGPSPLLGRRVSHSLPSAQEQLDFIQKLRRLMDEGMFVATYKYALLHAIADLCVIRGDDRGAPLTLSTRELADQFIRLYWRQAAPFHDCGASTKITRWAYQQVARQGGQEWEGVLAQ